MTDKCALVIHESKAVQIHVHNNRCCFCVPRVPGSVKTQHGNSLLPVVCLMTEMHLLFMLFE